MYANRFPADKTLQSPSKTPSGIISARRNKTPLKSDGAITPGQRSRHSIASGMTDSNIPEQSGSESFPVGDIADRSNRQILPVSIWRTYFIANEWFKIQTMRKVNILVQGIVTLFILEVGEKVWPDPQRRRMKLHAILPPQVLDIKFWARPDPDFTVRPVASNLQERESFTLKFAVGTLVYIFVHFVQWLTIVTIYERYIKNHTQEFVDLCSMANISVFILSQNRYGFYIHGR